MGMYSMVPMVNNTVPYIESCWKVDLNSSHHKEKKIVTVWWWTLTTCGNHLAMYTHTESCCIPVTNIML